MSKIWQIVDEDNKVYAESVSEQYIVDVFPNIQLQAGSNKRFAIVEKELI